MIKVCLERYLCCWPSSEETTPLSSTDKKTYETGTRRRNSTYADIIPNTPWNRDDMVNIMLDEEEKVED